MADVSQSERLMAAFPTTVRMYASYWETTREWGVVLRDIDMKVVAEGAGATFDIAIENMIAKAPSPEDVEDLF